MSRARISIAALVVALAIGAAPAAADEAKTWSVKTTASPGDDGRHVALSWDGPPGSIIVLRRDASTGAAALPEASQLIGKPVTEGAKLGPWTVLKVVESGGHGELADEVEPRTPYVYGLIPVTAGSEANLYIGVSGPAAQTAPVTAHVSYFNRERWGYLLAVVLIAFFLLVYMRIAGRRAKEIFIRRIPGVDAIEDAVGRSTEMGRPVLYVTGLEEIQDIQTLASLLVLGRVAEMTAEYDTELKVCNFFPLTMVVAEEIVRQGYANAGRLDAHKPDNVMFITAEQFAFAAAVNGIILRDRPATNIYLGRFFGESLLLAETGFLTGAVQIAGTAEFTQLPFFVAACDYTLIGEELYATSAYLSRDPNQLAQLKAGDAMKLLILLFVPIAALVATFEGPRLAQLVFP